ncbi:hypothetical protein JCM30237_27370 [Halolamina litorea]|uniref:WD40/YVTN/BNR-like repeat-containing protein n=1 Tax=Halolamina litorea TaxID=1515593 RepID=UPI002271BC32|nr:hypothetical protein [Halolamina litorea]
MWDTGAGTREPAWEPAETEFEIDLFDVVHTVEGPYAVGASGTLVADTGSGWDVVFDDGPATREAQLQAADVTADGRRVWMVGTSGVVACYDVEQARKFDYSSPDGMTSTWEGVAVAGRKGREKVLAANGSGEVLPFLVDGFEIDWGQPRKPAGKGANVAALAASPDGVGYAIDTAGNAFKTTQREGWAEIGILDSQLKLHDIHAGANGRVYVAAGDGNVYRYDDSYESWTPIGVTDGIALRAIDVAVYENGTGEMVVVGDDGSLYERVGDERWVKQPTPVDATLHGLSVGDLDVAVGTGGTVLERPQSTRYDRSSADGDTYDGRGETYDEPTDRRRTADADDAADGSDSEDGDAVGDGDDASDLTTGEVLVVLADELDIEELSSAAGYNTTEIQQRLIELADEVGVDPTRVRSALATDGGNDS